ncbi:MAG: Rieske 2Fe-2S domain-containing protein [Chloroflexota bacterium]
MLTHDANLRLTQVGSGTPMGELLRRYWFPVATTFELQRDRVLAVTLLGEPLTLVRTDSGRLGLLAQRCPHRGASLAYGIPEAAGLRCAYHGWQFALDGRCVDTPAEPASSTLKDRVKILAYPVQEMSGLIWAYLGPAPAPLLPRFDIYVWDDVDRDIGVTLLPCNWLQMVENSMDPVHVEYLHARYLNYLLRRQGKANLTVEQHHARIAFNVFEYGVYKRRLLEGQDEDVEDWRTGHPIVFPTTLRSNNGQGHPNMQIRVPIDDTHTRYYTYQVHPRANAEPQTAIPTYELPYRDPDGRLIMDKVLNQDMAIWITQGAVSDRSAERLGASDKGVILFRHLLEENLARMVRGEDPMGVVRDPTQNQIISLEAEGGSGAGHFLVRDLSQYDSDLWSARPD